LETALVEISIELFLVQEALGVFPMYDELYLKILSHLEYEHSDYYFLLSPRIASNFSKI